MKVVYSLILKSKQIRIRTIDKRRVGSSIGNLSIEMVEEIEKALLIHLGIEVNNL